MNEVSKQFTGQKGEQLAADYLVKKGYRLLDRNWRIRGGEIDIVAAHQGTIVFVEVKTRSSIRFGTPEESVGYRKLEFLKRAALFYLQVHPQLTPSYRFDVIAIELNPTLSIRHQISVTS